MVTLGGDRGGGAAVVSHHPAAEPQHRAGTPARHHQAGRPRLHPERHAAARRRRARASARQPPVNRSWCSSTARARESGLGKSLSSSQPTGGQGAAHPPRSRAVRCAGGLAGAAFAEPRRARGIRGNRSRGRTRARERRSRPQGGLSRREAPRPGAHRHRGARWYSSACWCSIYPRAGSPSMLPAQVRCAELGGSLWQGECLGLEFQGSELGDATWNLAPGKALTGRLAGDVDVRGSALNARADLDHRAQRHAASCAMSRARFPLDPAFVAQFPRDQRGNIVGRSQARGARRRARPARHCEGTIELHDFRQVGANPLELGSYRADLRRRDPAPNGTSVGKLRDLGGPFAVDGTLTLTPPNGYLVQGFITGRTRRGRTPGARNHARRAARRVRAQRLQLRRFLLADVDFAPRREQREIQAGAHRLRSQLPRQVRVARAAAPCSARASASRNASRSPPSCGLVLKSTTQRVPSASTKVRSITALTICAPRTPESASSECASDGLDRTTSGPRDPRASRAAPSARVRRRLARARASTPSACSRDSRRARMRGSSPSAGSPASPESFQRLVHHGADASRGLARPAEFDFVLLGTQRAASSPRASTSAGGSDGGAVCAAVACRVCVTAGAISSAFASRRQPRRSRRLAPMAGQRLCSSEFASALNSSRRPVSLHARMHEQVQRQLRARQRDVRLARAFRAGALAMQQLAGSG